MRVVAYLLDFPNVSSRFAMKRIRRKTSRITPARPGFTFLEFMVAMVVLGIALTGLFPLMVVCSRGVESLELRYTAEGNKNNNWFSPVYRTDSHSAGPIPREDYGTWYVIPSADPWASKLGAVATFSRTMPSASPSSFIVDDTSTSGYSTTGTWTTVTDAERVSRSPTTARCASPIRRRRLSGRSRTSPLDGTT